MRPLENGSQDDRGVSAEQERKVLEKRAAKLAQPRASRSIRSMEARVAVVKVGPEKLGIPVEGLREIISTPPITVLHGVPAWISGITQVRGLLVSVLHLGTWLESGIGTGQLLAVVAGAQGVLGLLVDEVIGFREIFRDEIAERGGAGARTERPIRATTRDLISILDLDRLLADERLVVDLGASGSPEGLL